MGGECSGASNRTVLIAIAMNALIAVAKGVGGTISGSSVLLSEAAHSVADPLNEAFLLGALRRGDRPADDLRLFGYGAAQGVSSVRAVRQLRARRAPGRPRPAPTTSSR